MRLYYKIKDMKKVFLLAFVLFAWSMVVNAQESDGKYIEVTGSSEIEVVPDEIHFLIQIKEYWLRISDAAFHQGLRNLPEN